MDTDDDEDDRVPAADIAFLQAALAVLTAKVDDAALQKAGDDTDQRKGQAGPVSAKS
ncbi:hypothetical protein L3Q67_35910 [Saccharothrix sp. AJ9571]|nr:hypothetical protein L3Q67_35910 [Saccharothrix sp. AJ9571]